MSQQVAQFALGNFHEGRLPCARTQLPLLNSLTRQGGILNKHQILILAPHPKKSTGLDPKTIWYAEKPLAEGMVFKHHFTSERTLLFENRLSSVRRL